MSRALVEQQPTTVAEVNFFEWVQEVSHADSAAKIARRIDVSDKTVTRWKDHDPSFRDVVKVAKWLEMPLLIVIRNAYGLSAKDLEQTDLDPRTLSDTDLLVQLVTRMHVDPEDLYQALGGGSHLFQSDRQGREDHQPARRKR